MVLAYLDAQAAKLSALDLAVRRDKPDAVHQMRVTVRRLRSTLQSFTSIVSKAETEHLRAELKWLGGVLGAARDNEVLADYLHAGLKAVPTELVLGPAQARITKHFAPMEASTRRAVLDALDSERYRALRAELGRLLDSPPLTPGAAEPAGKALPAAVGRAYRRTRRRMRRADHTPAGQAHDVALHETRKAAKRARYAAEAARAGARQEDRQEGPPVHQAHEARAVGARRPPGRGDRPDDGPRHRGAGPPGRRERLQLRPAARARSPPGALPARTRRSAPGGARSRKKSRGWLPKS